MAYFSAALSVGIRFIVKFEPNVYKIAWTSLTTTIAMETGKGDFELGLALGLLLLLSTLDFNLLFHLLKNKPEY